MKTISVISMLLTLLVLCLCFETDVKASDFGFTYWPAGYSCDCLYDENWTTAMRTQVEADLDLMASYSTKIIRLVLWPQVSGYLLHSPANGGNWGDGGFFDANFTEVTTNIVDIVEMCSERDIEIIIAFANQYHVSKEPNGLLYWWELGYDGYDYPDNPNAHENFCIDSVTWENGFIDKIEDSNWADTVIYYDYHSEWCSLRDEAEEYICYLYDNTNVPAGKRFIGPLILNSYVNDANEIKDALGARTVDAIDFHVYPYEDFCADIEDCYSKVHTAYPSADVYVGEFGSSGDANEPAQQDVVLDISDRLTDLGVAGFAHWMLWDYAPPSAHQIYAWGYDQDSPKDVMGGMSDFLTPVLNPDFELYSGTSPFPPTYWSAAGTVSVTLSTAAGGYSATNSRYARVKANYSSGTIWLSSGMIPVTGGDLLFINSYIRSNCSSVNMSVTQYNSSYTSLGGTNGPTFTPVWAWRNYMSAVGGWNMTLNANAAYVIVSIKGTLQTNPSYLDVDTVSVW